MKAIVRGESIEEIKKFLTDDEAERIEKKHRWTNSKEKVKLEISDLCDESLDKLLAFLEKRAKGGDRSAALSKNIVNQWLSIKQDPGGQGVSKLENIPSGLKAYIETTPRRYLFKQLPDGNSVPYFVTNVEYHAAKQFESPKVTVSLLSRNSYNCSPRSGDGTNFHIMSEDYRKKTMGEILQNQGFYLETEARMTEYESEMNRFMAVRSKDGLQLNVVGKAVSSSSWYSSEFHPVEKGGVPAKMVVDTNEGSECVFDLDDHVNYRVHVNNISAYIYSKDVGDKLVLPTDVKDLLGVLIAHATDSFSDIISGKEGGCIVMCAGAPGVGKTLTAEVYSEIMERPLYRVQSSQLGISVQALEEELKKVLRRAERWGAILLIDEADVYVRARGDEIEQNAIVGVFLRVLEYYRGVLFLTTNRGTEIDDAIVSRLTASINYEMPNSDDQYRLWKILGNQNNIDFSNGEIMEIIKFDDSLSGRDIKNLLKLASMVARSKDVPVSPGIVKQVSKFRQSGK